MNSSSSSNPLAGWQEEMYSSMCHCSLRITRIEEEQTTTKSGGNIIYWHDRFVPPNLKQIPVINTCYYPFFPHSLFSEFVLKANEHQDMKIFVQQKLWIWLYNMFHDVLDKTWILSRLYRLQVEQTNSQDACETTGSEQVTSVSSRYFLILFSRLHQ